MASRWTTCGSWPSTGGTGYDWRVHERRLNGFPQFTTEIDGQTVHFLHVRSARPGRAAADHDARLAGLGRGVHGGHRAADRSRARTAVTRADAFHMVIPSIPGFGFSGPTRERGWNVSRVARAWDELMRRLGYQRYGAQGGDWGSGISRELGVLVPEHVIGVHLNMLAPVGDEPPDLDAAGPGAGGAAAAVPGHRERVQRDPVDPAADGGLRPDRLAGRAAGLDRGEVRRVDRRRAGLGRPGSDAHQHHGVLADQDGRVVGAAVLRGSGGSGRFGRGAEHLDRAYRGGGVPRGDRGIGPAAGRTVQQHRALVGVRPGRPLRGDGGA